MTIYKITQTETHYGEANSLDEIREQWNNGLFDCGLIDVDISEADFENQDSQLEISETKICVDCGRDAEGSYHKNDKVTLTFSTLKQAQNEAIIQGIKYAMDYLEDVNYHTGANVVAELLDIIAGKANAPEWQSEFFAKPEHSLYSTRCEN